VVEGPAAAVLRELPLVDAHCHQILVRAPADLARHLTEGDGAGSGLLHCWPYHRQAGWLASVYPHVYVDVGLTVAQVGARAGAVLAELLELAPFTKVLFSTDAYRLPELYLGGAAQFRHSMGALLDGWVEEGAMAGDDAERVARLVGAENARRVYRRL
jgi:uncharacterized protein